MGAGSGARAQGRQGGTADGKGQLRGGTQCISTAQQQVACWLSLSARLCLLKLALPALTLCVLTGAGEPNFDSFVANPFQSRRERQEQEVRLLLDKLQPDTIMLDPDSIGRCERGEGGRRGGRGCAPAPVQPLDVGLRGCLGE